MKRFFSGFFPFIFVFAGIGTIFVVDQIIKQMHGAPTPSTVPAAVERPRWERICWDVARHYHEVDGGCRGPGCAESPERTLCEKHGRIR